MHSRKAKVTINPHAEPAQEMTHVMKERLQILTAIVMLFIFVSTPVFSELTEEDLSEIRKAVKEEISE